MKVLVTGASGFVGNAVFRKLSTISSILPIGSVRDIDHTALKDGKFVQIADIGPDTDWDNVLDEVEVVIHTAARVHIVRETASDPLREFRRTNTNGTLNLARQAAQAGVSRFIFISSIAVNGKVTVGDEQFSPEDVPAPVDAYGISKLEAEQGLREIAASTGMEVVIIRPPAIYGPGVRAYFQAMLRWVSLGVPLPLGAIDNKRSFIGLDNIVDVIVSCLEHPAAANETFLVSDGEDLSTTELLRRTGRALGRPVRLIPVPSRVIVVGAHLVNRPGIAQRLCDSLRIDISKTRHLLRWNPPVSVDEGLKKTAERFLRETRV